MKGIVLDIECGPSRAQWVDDEFSKNNPAFKYHHENTIRRELNSPPGNIKDEAKIEAWIKDVLPVKVAAAIKEQRKKRLAHNAKRKEAFSKLGIDPGTGETYCIGFAVFDFNTGQPEGKTTVLFHDPYRRFVPPPPAEPDDKGFYELFNSNDYEGIEVHEAQDEADMFKMFANRINTKFGGDGAYPNWVGHYINNFDIPYLWRRAMIMGFNLPPSLVHFRSIKAWGHDRTRDTRLLWDTGFKSNISLDRLCQYFGLPTKGDTDTIDGKDVFRLMKGSRINKADCLRVAAYCGHDVDRTLALYNRMVNN